ncbi:PREDICTED: globoside alpha-1,3-N-acetylgalactosaminyltransferase 1-like [Cyprinodon variegatus]|uniref:Globoside alpha-1,3-N-acetylgalactosaminyltransferase 1-like n=1 Tax=Cyprinodon variegatus TaxID=28743 RepID=A0A3Q2D915_CYPVA|nr:PREDICTED: globoside alpha-1,3-N-acetylgalactosaminyltransferase 1-like [Cyprinodon variegatus]
MALFLFCKSPAGPVRMNRIQLILCCFLLSLIIYFFNGSKAAVSSKSVHPLAEVLGMKDGRILKDTSVIKTVDPRHSERTSWGAPLVWGDSHNSVWRRAKLSEQGISVGLLVLVVGTYARFIRHFLTSAETHFLPGQMVTYYILTDNPRTLDPPLDLGPGRHMKVLPAAELPGWDRLAYRRMVLFTETIFELIGKEVDYIFCTDVDQEFVGPVGEEILGDLVATLHPEFFNVQRNQFPYEDQEDSSACVEEDEGDYYYTSEFYGGVVSQMRRLARDCSMLILQDEANKVTARALEESYLNRYLIDHRPTCVLSPEYSWWDSPLTVRVPKKRLVSLGRQCEAYDNRIVKKF